MNYNERLKKATVSSGLCVGLDPVQEKLPLHLRESKNGIRTFCEMIIAATAPYAAAYKPNLAFFEALDGKGMDDLHHIVESVRSYAPDAVVIGDAKRGDIGSTAERYASALFQTFGFDAATVNPLFGTDGIKPFTDWADKGVYLLAMTTNPSAVEVQDHGGESDPLYLRLASLAESTWNENKNVGLVVGATRPDRFEKVRNIAPSLPFLIPGVGAQGGSLEQAVALGSSGEFPGLINASRSIIYASDGEDFADAAADEAKLMSDAIASVMERTK